MSTSVALAGVEEQIDAANETGHAPVVFIHGLSRAAGIAGPSSSSRRATRRSLPVGRTIPRPSTRPNANPDVFAHKTIGQVADHFADTIGRLNNKPAVIGHSWAIANASYKKQKHNEGVTEIVEMPNRGHALTIDSGWREVADKALAFVQRFV
jgi:pimeloyl-ACP methyl ester carboxylesterase